MAIEYRSLFNSAEKTSPTIEGINHHVERMHSVRGRFYYGWEPPEICPVSFPACAPVFFQRLVNTPAFLLILEARGDDPHSVHSNAYTRTYLQVPGKLRIRVGDALNPASRADIHEEQRRELTEQQRQKIEEWEKKILDDLEAARSPEAAQVVCHVVINCNESDSNPINNFGRITHAVAHEIFGHVSRHLEIAENWRDSNYVEGLLPFYRRHYNPNADYENIDHGRLLVNDNFPDPNIENTVVRDYLNFRRAYSDRSDNTEYEFVWFDFKEFEKQKCEIIAAAGPVFPSGLTTRWRWWGKSAYCMDPVPYDPNDTTRKRFDATLSPFME